MAALTTARVDEAPRTPASNESNLKPAVFESLQTLHRNLVTTFSLMVDAYWSSAASHKLKLSNELYDITVFGAEPHANYNRILLSPVLAGEKSMDDIMLNTRDWYVQHGITLHAGDPVEHIDRRKRIVRARSGLEVHYDRLLIATGSKPFIIPVPCCMAMCATGHGISR